MSEYSDDDYVDDYDDDDYTSESDLVDVRKLHCFVKKYAFKI